jgi:hypothetical protein
MAIMLEECTTEEQRSVVCFLDTKGLNAKDIHNEVFLVYGGKWFSCKAVHNWVKKFSQGHSKVADDARPSAEVAETAGLLCCGLRSTGKAIGQVYQCWWRIYREINVFSRFHCHMFYVLYSFVTHLLALPHILSVNALLCYIHYVYLCFFGVMLVSLLVELFW